MKNFDFRSQSGQVAVVVFLIMAVLLVVGLSLAARTSQEIELAGQQEDTTRVFNAAETGIEQALSNPDNFELTSQSAPIPIQNIGDTQTSGTVVITPDKGFQNEFESGETATVFTTGTTGYFDILWSQGASNCNQKAVLAVTLYIEGGSGNYTAQHLGLRPQGCHSGTSFSEAPPTSGTEASEGWQHRYRINPLPANTKMVRIKPLMASAHIKINAANNVLSPQVYNIRSEARDASSGNTEVRAIEVTRTAPAPPSVFDYALYSGGDLTK